MSRAEKIADLICGVDIDDRGILFQQVEAELAHRSQFYTASLFRTIARMSGVTEPRTVGREH